MALPSVPKDSAKCLITKGVHSPFQLAGEYPSLARIYRPGEAAREKLELASSCTNFGSATYLRPASSSRSRLVLGVD